MIAHLCKIHFRVNFPGLNCHYFYKLFYFIRWFTFWLVLAIDTSINGKFIILSMHFVLISFQFKAITLSYVRTNYWKTLPRFEEFYFPRHFSKFFLSTLSSFNSPLDLSILSRYSYKIIWDLIKINVHIASQLIRKKNWVIFDQVF